MNRIAVSAAAMMLAAAPVLADSHDLGENLENAAESAVNSAQNTAENAETMAENAAGMTDAELIRTRDITGGEVYSLAEGEVWDETSRFNAVGDGWNDIGEIEDIVLSRDGQLKGVVAEIGGFLDIADKHVMLEVTDMQLVPVDDREYAIVTRMTEEELEQLPEVDEGFWE